MTFFFRMAYSESSFIFLTVLAMTAMERQWMLVIVAGIVGLATAARPVGIALVPAFLLYLWQRSPRTATILLSGPGLLLVACSGLLAYMGYLYFEFGQPLAFALTQDHWRTHPQLSWTDRLFTLATLEPLWGAMIPSSSFYWERFESHDNPFFSLTFVNPIAFVSTGLLTVCGLRNGWLNAREGTLAIGLLVVPYLTRGYDNALLGGGRFAAVAVPAYLVAGQLLSRLPNSLAQALIGLCGFFLGTYAALFAAGYRYF
jgi:hypothetical protein